MDVRAFGRALGQGSMFSALYVPVRRTQGQALHLFNQVSFTSPSWGVTFEHCLPWLTRLAPDHPLQGWLRKPLVSDRCKFVIGISEWARRFLLASLTAEQAVAVEPKLFVVPPFQAMTDARPKAPLPENEPIVLGFVGRNFFRKGGEAVLEAVERYGEELNLTAVVVSQVAGSDYLTGCVSEAHTADVRRRLASRGRVKWHQELANAEVLRLMQAATLGVLPTMSDTYGYSLLEAMSLGLPVIGTNVQAGLEISTPDVGWRLDLELRGDGFLAQRGSLDWGTYRRTVDYLTDGIGRAARQLRDEPELLTRLSAGALSCARRPQLGAGRQDADFALGHPVESERPFLRLLSTGAAIDCGSHLRPYQKRLELTLRCIGSVLGGSLVPTEMVVVVDGNPELHGVAGPPDRR